MEQQDLLSLTRVRLAALSQAARAGSSVTAYDLSRALQPMLDLAMQIGVEAGRWQATHAAAIAARAAADAEARATYGPGADAPGEDPAAIAMPARRGSARIAGRL